MINSLPSLLGPIDEKKFLDEIWEKDVLYVPRGKPEYYDELFSMEQLDALIAQYDGVIRHPGVMIKHKSQLLSREAFCVPGDQLGSWVVSMTRVLQEYAKGSTIIFHDLQRLWFPVSRLCRALHKLFHFTVGANVYLSPPRSEFGNLHFDDHGVLILQVSGSKRWRIYDPIYPFPHDHQRFLYPPGRPVPESKLVKDVTLERGDLLYVPRGFPHETATSDGPSLHVSVGLDEVARTGWEYIKEALEQTALSDVRFREVTARGRPFSAQSYRALIEALRAADLKRVEAGLHRRSFQKPGILEGSLLNLEELRSFGPRTRVRAREDLPYAILDHDLLSFALVFNGKQVVFLNAYHATVEALARSTAPVSTATLSGPLSAETKLEIVRKLVKESFLLVCQTSQARGRRARMAG